MTPIDIQTYHPDHLKPLIDLVNEAISGRRFATTVTAGEYRRRVLDHPGFDPDGLLLAVDRRGRVLGGLHAIRAPAHLPRYARTAGHGFLLGPYVRPGERRGGIGRALLTRGEGYLRPASHTLYLHGIRAPFYHSMEGPRQPYCGSTELIGLTRGDEGLLSMARAAGYTPSAEREVSMLLRLQPAAFRRPRYADLRLVDVGAEEPWPGPVAWLRDAPAGYGYEQYGIHAYQALAAVKGESIVGHCLWYPMRQPGRAVLYELRLEESLRGRGLGKALLQGALAAMAQAGYREAELHTSPQRSPVAYPLYRQCGFEDVLSWIALEKRLRPGGPDT